LTEVVNQLTRLGYSQEEALRRLRQHNWDLQTVLNAIAEEDEDRDLDSQFGDEEVVESSKPDAWRRYE
jgi:uncharacterized UBP type Zn finger protein